MPVALTTQNFKENVEKDGILIIDWWAEWCGPCKRFAPIFEEASKRHPDVTFAKIDTDAQQELAQGFQIQSIPTLMIFRDQVLLFSEPGMVPGDALDEILGKVKALDMAVVKKEIADQQKNAPS
jgi:thioredoxin 1